MVKLRAALSENLKVYRNEMGFSQAKLAELVDSAPNYIAMIESRKRFPSDAMLEKMAAALQKEPCELFSMPPLLHKQMQETLLAEFADFLSQKLQGPREAPRNAPCGAGEQPAARAPG